MIGIILLSIITAAIYFWIENGGGRRFHIRLGRFFEQNAFYLGMVIIAFYFVISLFFNHSENDFYLIKGLDSIVEILINCLFWLGVLAITIGFLMRKKPN
ncbi:putative membrane protein [Pectobacterium atrosepticum SCRI1043]|uniref:Membrane protein n=2 Tax=Pectobacterium atrosepticum TaxID=29471 RepID=Q6D9R4_PECAS|nr:hypothetical protein [Pectobacterium atrosepticum]GKV85793.1 hypothetical protein PEC301296_21050 [Pectobacterium carotovorum subsp. carotovorum]AFH56843.1 hypothetical protein KCQ_12995 [Pectobacterium atrosepticum]AIA69884.1 hypothetical protein EV46_04625 [Pectobacterium atrosepticum]AIK12799.1 putative membrane protein [Pectobacterium atrosepticum]ATY89377.1 hypothetical protein CVS35_02855 [Pectobacterium atrosepticum]